MADKLLTQLNLNKQSEFYVIILLIVYRKTTNNINKHILLTLYIKIFSIYFYIIFYFIDNYL